MSVSPPFRHALPSNIADPPLRTVGWLAAAAFAGNVLREWIVPRRGLGWAMALWALDAAGRSWSDAFLGTGAEAVGAAAAAGLAVAPLARRAAPTGTMEVGERAGLPPLPGREAILHSNVAGEGAGAVLRRVAAAFRSISRDA